MDIAAQLILSFCIASATGLRAFLPLLVLSILSHTGYVHLNSTFAWVGSREALVVLGVAAAVDFLADKIPGLDHALDLVHTLIRPLAGVIAMACTQQHVSPHYAVLVGLAIGLPTAGAVHVLKSGTRIASTATTGGCLSPVLSLGEDIASLGITLTAVAAPVAALALVVAGMILLAKAGNAGATANAPRRLRWTQTTRVVDSGRP